MLIEVYIGRHVLKKCALLFSFSHLVSFDYVEGFLKFKETLSPGECYARWLWEEAYSLRSP